jgi:hypothetical protein
MLSVPAREECLVCVIAHMGKGRIMVTVGRRPEVIGISLVCRYPIDYVSAQEWGLTVETTTGTSSSTSRHALQSSENVNKPYGFTNSS